MKIKRREKKTGPMETTGIRTGGDPISGCTLPKDVPCLDGGVSAAGMMIPGEREPKGSLGGPSPHHAKHCCIPD